MNNCLSARRTSLLFFLVILLAAGGLRVLYLLDFASLPLFGQITGPDVSEYYAEAQQIRAGQWFGQEVRIHAPLYPFLLAAILSCTNGDLFWTRLVHILLFAVLTLTPVYFMLRKRAAGVSSPLRFLPLAGTLLLGAYPPLIIYQGDFYSENLMLVMLLFSLWCFSLHRKYADFAAGLCCGLAMTAHPGCVFFLPLGCLYAGFRLYRKNTPDRSGERRKALLRAASMLGGALLMVLPVAVRNSMLARRFVLIQDNSMFNLVLGNSPDSTGTCRIPPGSRWDAEFEKAHRLAAEQGISVDSYYRNQFFGYIAGSPLHYLKMLLKKAAMSVSCREFTTWSDAVPMQLIPWHRYLYHNWFMLLLLLGGPPLLLGLPHRHVRRFLGPELILFAAAFAGQVFFLTAGRYRLPLIVPLAVFAAYFLCRMKFFLGPLPMAGGTLIAMAALFLIGCYPYAIPRQMEIDYARSLLASAYIQAGKPAEAVRIYGPPSAGECFPDRRLTVLGQAWHALGDLKRSGSYYLESVRKYPGRPEGYLNYASVLSDTGRFAEAEKILSAGLALKPRGRVLADMEYNSGEIAQRTRRLEQAEKHYLAALSVLPSHRKALNNLGSVYIVKRQPEKALPLFEKAVMLEPDNLMLRVNLALSLAMGGREAEADRVVTEILERDPKCVPALRLRQAIRR